MSRALYTQGMINIYTHMLFCTCLVASILHMPSSNTLKLQVFYTAATRRTKPNDFTLNNFFKPHEKIYYILPKKGNFLNKKPF